MTSYDVVVVGAGVVGAAAAAALADASLSVAVVTGGERAAVSATAASGGLVRCYETDPAQRALALRSHELLWRRAPPPESAGHHRTGSPVCPTAHEAEKADLAIAGLQANDAPAPLLEPAQVARRGPHPRAGGFVAAVGEPPGGYADPPRTAAMLLDRARRHGAHVLDDRVLAITLDGARVHGVSTRSGDLAAPAVVLAAGSRSPELLPPGIASGLRTRRVRYAFVGWSGWPLPTVMDHVTGMWGRPHGPDRLLVGRPVEEWNVAAQVGGTITDAQLRHIRRGGVARWPALATAPLRGARWGTDLYSPTGPLLGPVESHPGLVLATAWSGAGFKTAPAAGEAVVQAVIDSLR